MTNGPKFYSAELEYLNTPPPYQYLEIKDPLMKEHQKRRRKQGSGSDVKNKFKNLTLRDYIGEEHFRFAESQE